MAQASSEHIVVDTGTAGLTTLSTFLIALWMFWGAVNASLSAIQTTVNTTATAAASNAPAVASHLAGDAIWVLGIIWGGIFLGCLASLIGSGFAARRSPGYPAASVTPQPVFRESPPSPHAGSA